MNRYMWWILGAYVLLLLNFIIDGVNYNGILELLNEHLDLIEDIVDLITGEGENGQLFEDYRFNISNFGSVF